MPIEVLEAAMPIVFDRKELRHDSGGAGRMQGGDGQFISFHMRTRLPLAAQLPVPSRLLQGPDGIDGGAPGLHGPLPGQRRVREPGA